MSTWNNLVIKTKKEEMRRRNAKRGRGENKSWPNFFSSIQPWPDDQTNFRKKNSFDFLSPKSVSPNTSFSFLFLFLDVFLLRGDDVLLKNNLRSVNNLILFRTKSKIIPIFVFIITE